MANLTIPSSINTTGTSSLQINQDVGYGKPQALEYSGAGKSVIYSASQSNMPFKSYKKVPNTNGGQINSPTTAVAAFAALASDAFNYWVDGGFEPVLFSSLAEFELYVDRDTRITTEQHPRRNETSIKIRNKVHQGSYFDIYQIPSLAEVCQSLLVNISSFIKTKKITKNKKVFKSRYKELKRILSPGNDGTFPHIDELWNGTNDSDSDSDSDDDEDTDEDTDPVVEERRKLHVVDLFSSLGQVFNVVEWADSEDDDGYIIKKKYNGSGCGIDKQLARHQQMRKDMVLGIQEDWLVKYGIVLDLDYPDTLMVGPDKYIPLYLRPNDDDENVSQGHIDSAEARWDALYQQSVNKRKQEQGEEYNELFELSDESSSTAFFSIEDYEESIVSCSYVV